ncbi:MAG: C40 family peptidase [Clostridia bacterium]|nr:C40 family peptidase [Clostridia bacterium]
MKKQCIAACVAAVLIAGVPLAACGTEEDGTANTVPVPGETDVVSPAPEIPDLPELPDDPQPPETADPPTTPDPEPEPETPPVSEPIPLLAQYIYVRSNGLNVRAGAGTAYTSLGTVESDVLLKFVGKTDGWYETVYKNRTAYVSANEKYTSVTLLDKGEGDVENVIEEGLRLLGVPYVYGAVRLHDGNGNFLKGFTVKQFDCSSLMQYIFYQGAGKLLNMNTRTQVSQGKEVAKKDIKRGDLLFFTNASRKNNTGVERIGHVALYLGDNYILHTASDYAKIEQISSQRWSYYITARRVL